ncbi:MAG: CopG family transcriptional regulator [Calditrichaeota bacterium]|nr:MAG: CopG family transcriptional regulator [Calditrichota bacterium]
MKAKTTITIDADLLDELNRLSNKEKKSRSAIIEELIKNFLDKNKFALSSQNEIAQINKIADELNKEAMDVLNYQVDL